MPETAVQTPKVEKVYFSSRSRHTKVKVKPVAPSAEATSPRSRKLSTFSSIKESAHSVLPGRGRAASNASTSKSASTSKASGSAVWGSTSTGSGALLHEISEPPSSPRNVSPTRSSPHGSQHSIPHDDSGDSSSRRGSISESIHSGHGSDGGRRASLTSKFSEQPSVAESKWWDDNRIGDTVTEEYIASKIPLVEGAGLKAKLQAPVSFGDGLTETTYVEWIMTRARRFFLILVELDIPEQIFGIVDDSWGDDDLPLSADAIPRLKLCRPADPLMDKKFAKIQYTYLVRFLHHGTHIDFEDFETVPLDVVPPKQKDKLLINHHSDNVRCPRDPNVTFSRQKFQLYDRQVAEDFMAEVEAMRDISHQHIVELYCSYTHQGYGYLLLSPATDFNLRTFLQHTPNGFKKLTEDSRRFKLLDWMYCLADALAFLYDRGIAHRDIRPKSIVIDPTTGNIFFGDIGSSRRLDITPLKIVRASENEKYEYGAPELWLRTVQHNISLSPTQLHFDGGRTGRKLPTTTSSGATGATPADLLRRVASPENVEAGPPIQPAQNRRNSSHSESTANSIHSNTSIEGISTLHGGVSSGPVKLSEWMSKPAAKSDVFSLGCVFLDMLTFHSHKKSLSSFSHHRAKHNRAAGSRGGGQPDSSFHSNLEQTNEWIKDLKKEAVKRDDDAVQATLILISRMLEKEPDDRPTPREAGDRLFAIMRMVKKPHCELHVDWNTDDTSGSFSNWSGWDDSHDYLHNHRLSGHHHMPNLSIVHRHTRNDSHDESRNDSHDAGASHRSSSRHSSCERNNRHSVPDVSD